LEIDPSNRCPLNCKYCNWAELRAKNQDIIPESLLLSLVKQTSKLGVKAIIWTGGGEPLTNPATIKAIQLSKELGIDNGLFTNGVLLDKKINILVNSLCWIRFNMAGSDRIAYSKIHGVDPSMFDLVCKNIKNFTKANKNKIGCGIGVAINPDNFESVKKLPYLANQLKLEYFQGKLDFKQVGSNKYVKWWKKEVLPYFNKVEKDLRGKIKVHIFSDPIIRKTEIPYCHAHHIITAITADGRVTFCKMRRNQRETSIGNIYKNTLKEIFCGQKHKTIANEISPRTCSILSSFCPYRTTNEIVQELKDLNNSFDSKHKNFF